MDNPGLGMLRELMGGRRGWQGHTDFVSININITEYQECRLRACILELADFVLALEDNGITKYNL